ncbi:Actin cytoskeleton-regulatory complex protein SLA1, partial [Smittium mucronatum]
FPPPPPAASSIKQPSLPPHKAQQPFSQPPSQSLSTNNSVSKSQYNNPHSIPSRLQPEDYTNDQQAPPALPPKDNSSYHNPSFTSQKKTPLNSQPKSQQIDYARSGPTKNISQKKNSAKVLYSFDSSNSDEISIKEGQEVEIIEVHDNGWCLISSISSSGGRSKGLVPYGYLEPSTNISSSSLPTDSKKSGASGNKSSRDYQNNSSSQSKISNKGSDFSESKPKNDAFVNPAKESKNPSVLTEPDKPIQGLRTWTDLSGSFSIEARFLYLNDGMLAFLVKSNGVEVQIPFDKLSSKDQEYINRQLAETNPPVPVAISSRPWKMRNNHNFDWFDFLTLKAGINADKALRYDTSFTAEGLDEESMSELVDEKENSTLKSLGVNDSDIDVIIISFKKHLKIPFVDNTSSEAQKKRENVKNSTYNASNFNSKPISSSNKPLGNNQKPIPASKPQPNQIPYKKPLTTPGNSFDQRANNPNTSAPIDDAWNPKSKLKPVLGSKVYNDATSNTNVISITNKAPIIDSAPKPEIKSNQADSFLDQQAKKKAQELAEHERRLALEQQELKKASLLLQQQQNHLMQLQQTQQVEQQLSKIKEQRERQESENQRKNILSQQAQLEQQRKQLEDMRKAIEQNNLLFKQQPNVFSTNPAPPNTSNIANAPKLMPPIVASKPQQPQQSAANNQMKSAFAPTSFNQFSSTNPSSNPSTTTFVTNPNQKYNAFSNINPNSSSVFNQKSDAIDGISTQSQPSNFTPSFSNSNQFIPAQQLNSNTVQISNKPMSSISAPNAFQNSQMAAMSQETQIQRNQLNPTPQLSNNPQSNQFYTQQFSNTNATYNPNTISSFSNQSSMLQNLQAQNPQLSGNQFQANQMQASQLASTQLQNTQISGSQQQNVQMLNQPQSLQRQGSQGISSQQQGSQLNNNVLQNSQMMNAQPQRSQSQNAGFQNTQFQNVQVQNPQMQGTQFQNTQLQNTLMQNTQFQNPQLQNQSLASAQLQNMQFVNNQIPNNQVQSVQNQSSQLLNSSVGQVVQSPTQFQSGSIQNTSQVQYPYPNHGFNPNNLNMGIQPNTMGFSNVGQQNLQGQMNFQPVQPGTYNPNPNFQQNVVGFNPNVLGYQTQSPQQFAYYNNQQQPR